MISRGFTLIEVVIAITISAVVGILLTQLVISNDNIFFDQTNQVQQGISLNDSISRISSDIKSAAGVASGYPVASPTVNSDASHLVLQLPSIDVNNNPIAGTYDYIVVAADYSLSNVLREKVYPDPTSSRAQTNRVLASNLVSLNLTYYDSNGNPVTPTASGKINVAVTLNVSSSSKLTPRSANATVNLRNN